MRVRGLLNHGAVRRAGRAAVVMPLVFAFGSHVVGNPTVALFASFGSFAQVLFVEFGGPRLARVQAQLGLIVVGAALLCVGTLASANFWLGAAVMAVVSFAVLFAGVVSSVFASAGTSLVLALILAISIPGDPASIPDRLLGWGIASVAALLAITLLWPTRSEDPLRAPAARACRAAAARLRSDEPARGAGDEIAALHRSFLGTPYRPTGLTTSARTLVRLVDELNWLGVILAGPVPPESRESPESREAAAWGSAAAREAAGTATTEAGAAGPDVAGTGAAGVGAAEPTVVGAVLRAAADVLDRSADLLEATSASLSADADARLRGAGRSLDAALAELERQAGEQLPVSVGGHPEDVLTALEPGFRAEELSFVVSLVARNVATAAAADRRGWWERLLGLQPDSVSGAWRSAVERASAHVEWHSVWLHNSVRGAAGLALAVLVADLSGVSHSFWVVLGTLSVLRSNALNTGQTVARGVLGTALGFAVGSAVLTVVGTDTRVLWILLPVAVLVAGVAPALIGFATGQAAFTVVLLILFNITAPAGWELGLVRLEDVALGCAVSVVVGLLFWPRGAAATLRFALAEAYVDSARYLDAAVHYAAARCDPGSGARGSGNPGAGGAAPGGTAGGGPAAGDPVTGGPAAEDHGTSDAAAAAAASARRLDDTLRTYLTERGPKPTPLAELMTLVTGVAVLRLAAGAILELWRTDPGQQGPGDRSSARAELRRRSEKVTGWYEQLGERLAADLSAPAPLPSDRSDDHTLIDAVRRDLAGAAAATGVRVIWTADHLDAARRVQPTLLEPAHAAVDHRSLRPHESR